MTKNTDLLEWKQQESLRWSGSFRKMSVSNGQYNSFLEEAMSNGKDVDEARLRLFKLQAKVNELVLADTCDPMLALEEINNAYQKIMGMSPATRTASKFIILDQKFFRRIESFELTVPIDYVFETQLMNLKYKSRKDFDFFDNEITDENFAKTSHRLIPGKTYLVHIIGIVGNRSVPLSDCLKTYQTLGAYYTGAHGLALAWELEKERFPEDSRILSISGFCYMPSISRVYTSIHKTWWFKVGVADESVYLYNNDYLLCFCDLK